MKLSAFKYNLPQNQIAQYPTDFRDDCRLMVFHKETGEVEHKKFRDLLDYFDADDMLIGNDTKVFPARLYGKKEKTGAHIEVFLLRELNPRTHLWDVIVDPARKIRVGNKLYFGEGELVAEVIDNTTSRGRTIAFSCIQEYDFYETIYELGQAPIPRVLGREAEERDIDDFQTVYAKHPGAVMAPSAGLHFTESILKMFELKGVHWDCITSHIGLGMFREVEVEDLTKHKMDSESFYVSGDLANKISKGLRDGKRVCSVGGSVLRTLESCVSADKLVKGDEGWTDKFIAPPYPTYHV